MRRIGLSQGFVAVVDDEDFERLNRHKWSAKRDGNRVYAVRKAGQRLMFLHHMILGSPVSGAVVDHISGDSLDNRKENLRFVSTRENAVNTRLHRSGRLPWTTKMGSRWKAQVKISGRKVHVGMFETETAAHEAAKSVLSRN